MYTGEIREAIKKALETPEVQVKATAQNTLLVTDEKGGEYMIIIVKKEIS